MSESAQGPKVKIVDPNTLPLPFLFHNLRKLYPNSMVYFQCSVHHIPAVIHSRRGSIVKELIRFGSVDGATSGRPDLHLHSLKLKLKLTEYDGIVVQESKTLKKFDIYRDWPSWMPCRTGWFLWYARWSAW